VTVHTIQINVYFDLEPSTGVKIYLSEPKEMLFHMLSKINGIIFVLQSSTLVARLL
jgi:hypothetical protein